MAIRGGAAELIVKRRDVTMHVFPKLGAPATPHDAYTAQTISVLLPQTE